MGYNYIQEGYILCKIIVGGGIASNEKIKGDIGGKRGGRGGGIFSGGKNSK